MRTSLTRIFSSGCGHFRKSISSDTTVALIKTDKLNSVDLQAWLTDVLGSIAEHNANRIDEMLPWRYADGFSVTGPLVVGWGAQEATFDLKFPPKVKLLQTRLFEPQIAAPHRSKPVDSSHPDRRPGRPLNMV